MSQEILDAMIIERNGSDSAVSKKGVRVLSVSTFCTALSIMYRVPFKYIVRIHTFLLLHDNMYTHRKSKRTNPTK